MLEVLCRDADGVPADVLLDSKGGMEGRMGKMRRNSGAISSRTAFPAFSDPSRPIINTTKQPGCSEPTHEQGSF